MTNNVKCEISRLESVFNLVNRKLDIVLEVEQDGFSSKLSFYSIDTDSYYFIKDNITDIIIYKDNDNKFNVDNENEVLTIIKLILGL